MSIQSRRELLSRITDRYRESNRRGKKDILNELVVTTDYSTEYAVSLLNRAKIRPGIRLRLR